MRLFSPRKDGRTLAEHAQAVFEQTGAWPEDIPEPPEIECGLLHLWEAYWEVRAGVASGFAGPNPIGSAEMLAWNSVTGGGFGAWHFQVLRIMDAAYLGEWGEMQKK